MSLLTIHNEYNPEVAEIIMGKDAIAAHLQDIGVLFEQWEATSAITPDADQDTILNAYAASVERLKTSFGFQSADVISVEPDHPDRLALRAKFLNEHTHSDFEVRFFVNGKGLFYLHPDERVFAVLCERGDLISVPANTRHWFDMGVNPHLQCIRLFTTPEGWVADFTGSKLSSKFPSLEEYLRNYA